MDAQARAYRARFVAGVFIALIGVIVITGFFVILPASTSSNCQIKGILRSSPTNTIVQAGSQVQFNGKLYIASSICTEDLSGITVYYWQVTNGVTGIYSSTSTISDGTFSFVIQAPSNTPSSYYVETSLCITLSGCTTQSIQTNLVVTSGNPTSYVALTFQTPSANPITGITVTIQTSNGASICQGQDSSSGIFSCSGLVAGSYTWSFVDPSGVYGTPNSGTFLVTGSTPFAQTETISPLIATSTTTSNNCGASCSVSSGNIPNTLLGLFLVVGGLGLIIVKVPKKK